MDRLLDPTNDWAFKQVFGQEKHKNIVISFLNSMLVEIAPKVVDIDFLPTATDSELANLRQSIVDVRCRTKDGVQFIVEMQRASDSNFIPRAYEYAHRVYLSQRTIDKKEENDRGGYDKVSPVIFFAVMGDTLFEDNNDYLSHHQMLNIKNHKNYIGEVSFSFLEITKFNKKFSELQDEADRWAYFFKMATQISPDILNKITKQSSALRDAYQALERSAYTPEELLEYTKYELKQEEIQTKINDARKLGKEEGLAEGMEKGLAMGEEKGLAEGMEKGLAMGEEKGAHQKAIENARRMLRDQLPLELIAEYSGLSVEEVNKLQGV